MSLRRPSTDNARSQNKKVKTTDSSNALHKCLEESGLALKHPPEKCRATQEIVQIIRNVKRNLQNQFDYPRNVIEVFNCFVKECKDLEVFRHYLFPNIMRQTEDSTDEHLVSVSVIKILLSIPILQKKLTDYIFERAMDLAVETKCGPWIQMILKCFSNLDTIVNTEKVSSYLVDLLDVATERMVRLEIIVAIPDIIGDQEHENIANEMSRFLSEDHELIPAILDCLSYLSLSDDQYEQLQRKTLNILTTLPKCSYFANFVKFLLMPGRLSDSFTLEAVKGLRNALGWPTSLDGVQEIATSQVLTASALRNAILSSKVVGNSWLKTLSSCKVNTEQKAIDFAILLILYSTTEERQKQVENLIRKQVKLGVMKEDLLDDAFEKFRPIFREYLRNLIELANSLLKTKSDPTMEMFASHLYSLMFSHLEDCRETVIAELLQLGLNCKQCVMSTLVILTNVATKDMAMLKPQSLQMLTLLDRMDGMSLTEIKAVMNLVCGLAYSFENSVIRDDVHMIIRKELSNSSPALKIQGILAGVHAIKYLIANNEDEENAVDDDAETVLSEGPLREAAHIIELISCSTKQFPDIIAFFYDELTDIISSATYINKHFMSWLTDAVTNDLQNHFITDTVPTEKVGELKLSLQYCLNADSEMDEIIAINIAGLALVSKDEVNVGIISPLFQLIQTLHYKQHEGDLSSIDALLGCPVIMPKYDIDLIEDMDHKSVSNILDCLIYCVNWFRELLNAFATQNDEVLKSKLLHRILHIEQIETEIQQILMKNQTYKPPMCTFDFSKYTGDQIDKKSIKPQPKQRVQKRHAQDDTVLPETAKSQPTQNSIKNKPEAIKNIPLRPLCLKLLNLFNNDLSTNADLERELNIKTFMFLLKSVNSNLETILVSKIKKKSFLTKKEVTYDPKKAEECAKSCHEILPKIVGHLNFVTSYLESKLDSDEQEIFTSGIMDYLESLESLYKMLTTYFKWLGFRNHNTALLKSSLIKLTNTPNTSAVMSLKDLTAAVAKDFQKHEKYCVQLSTAVALIDLLKAIQEHSNSTTVLTILRNMSKNFLSKQWKSPDGAVEKGLLYNQNVDKLAAMYFLNNELVALKQLAAQLTNDIENLKGRHDTLSTMKCINKSNFPILFRNLGTAVHDATKARLDSGLTNAEHLDLWKDVVLVLKYMTDISKTLETRNNLSAFFKKSLPILKLFISQGIPIIEMQFKDNTEEVLEILKVLQQSTRFLQSLCCHSRLKKDTALMSKVPFVRQMLETLIYKVKAALASNNCSEAFWMGNLKNKNIHGEVIATQQSISEESVEDCDDQLPDDDSDDSDDDIINPESKSMSDVL